MGHKSQCSEAEKGAFKIASVLYSLCYLLAPELQNDFPITLPRNFVPDFKPVEINWARFVLWTLGVVLQSMRVHKSEMETRRLEFLDALYYFRYNSLVTSQFQSFHRFVIHKLLTRLSYSFYRFSILTT